MEIAQQTYTGYVYDGRTSARHRVVVRLSNQTLSLQSYEHPHEATVQWELAYVEVVRLSSDHATLTYKLFDPAPLLDVSEPGFVDDLKAALGQSLGSKPLKLSRATRIFLLVASLMVTIGAALYLLFWQLIPNVADQVAQRLSIDQQVSLQKATLEYITEHQSVDQARSRVLQKFVEEYRISDPQFSHSVAGYPIQALVLESDELNAFALPGGTICVYSALLDSLKQPEELAGLISHEYGHVAKRHGVRNILRALGTNLIIAVMVGNSDGIPQTVLTQGGQLKMLEYSRGFEEEADTWGANALAERGINPNGMIMLFHRFQRMEKRHKGPLDIDFLSTHPNLGKRIERIQKRRAEEGYKAYPGPSHKLVSLFAELKERN